MRKMRRDKFFIYLSIIFLLFSFSYANEINYPPSKPTTPNPVNNATGVPVIVNLSCYVSDPDNDVINVAFYWVNVTFEGEINLTNISFYWINGTDIGIYDLINYTAESQLIGIAYNVTSGSIAKVGTLYLEYNKTYYWYAVANDSQYENASEVWKFTTAINHPPNKPSVEGITYGYVDIAYTFFISSSDPDGDRIKYAFDWNGDELIDEWTDYYASGVIVNISHSWHEAGTYYIAVIAQDENGMENISEIVVHISHENIPPFCSLEASNSHGYIPFNVTFFISANDEDGYISSWSFDADNDGAPEYDGDGSPPSQIWYVYNDTGNFTAKLTVVDNDGAINSAEALIIAYLLSPPEILDISPKQVSAGATLNITIAGKNFVNDTIILTDSPYIDVIYTWFVDNETIVARISVDENATEGKINITAVNPDGQACENCLLIERVEKTDVIFYLLIILVILLAATIGAIWLFRGRVVYAPPIKEIPISIDGVCVWRDICLRFFVMKNSSLAKNANFPSNKNLGTITAKEEIEKIEKAVKKANEAWKKCCIRFHLKKPVVAIDPEKTYLDFWGKKVQLKEIVSNGKLDLSSGLKVGDVIKKEEYVDIMLKEWLEEELAREGLNEKEKEKIIKTVLESLKRNREPEDFTIEKRLYKKIIKLGVRKKWEEGYDKLKDKKIHIPWQFVIDIYEKAFPEEKCLAVFVFKEFKGEKDATGDATLGHNGILIHEKEINEKSLVLAHELGHNLGLEHVDTEDNLMHVPVKEGNLTKEQCKKAHQTISKLKLITQKELKRALKKAKEEKKRLKDKRKTEEKKVEKMIEKKIERKTEEKTVPERRIVPKQPEKKVELREKEIKALQRRIKGKEEFIRKNYVKNIREYLIKEYDIPWDELEGDDIKKWKWPKEWEYDDHLSTMRNGYEEQMRELEKLREKLRKLQNNP